MTSIDEFIHEVGDMSDDDLYELLEEASSFFIPDEEIRNSIPELIAHGIKCIFGDDGIPENIDLDTLKKMFETRLFYISVVHNQFWVNGLLNKGCPMYSCNISRFNKIFELLHYYELSIRSSIMMRTAASPIYDSVCNSDVGLHRFMVVDYELNNPLQNLLIYLMNRLLEKGYRRQTDICMRRVYTPEGHDTRAWEAACTIKEFIYSVTGMSTNYNQWLNLTSSGANCKNAETYLKETSDCKFMDIQKDRHLFSFNNGIFETHNPESEELNPEGNWYPYIPTDEHPIPASSLETSRVACKYFDCDFDTDYYEDWYDIPTPYFQSIMDYQQFPEEACRWMYILVCGRILYEVNEMDQWQVIPFLKGQAGTGKSTIVTRVCNEFFDSIDVGVLSNNVEKKFGLSALKDNLLCIAPEIKRNFGLEQAEFQSMISGEPLSTAKKHETATSDNWKVPLIIAGNEAPGYMDNAGSIARRIICWGFGVKVVSANMMLGDMLKKEIPNLIKKGNRAYLEEVKKNKNNDLWNVLPAYFKNTKKDLAKLTNPLAAFIGSTHVELGKEHFCKYSIFVAEYNNFVQSMNLKKIGMTDDYCSGPFYDNKIKKISNPPLSGLNKKDGPWLTGIKIVNTYVDDDNN